MGKVVKTVLKVAAVAAVAYFAPQVAIGLTSNPAVGTAIAAGVGAGMGKIIPGVTTTQGMFAGGLGGAGRTGLLGGSSQTATAATGAGGPATTAPTAGVSTAPTAAASQTAGGSVANVFRQGVGNLTTGLGAALGGAGGTLGTVAPQLLAAGLVGNPGGELAKAQQAELARAQQVNAALTQQRLDQANQLFNEAAYYDPEYMARQAAEAAMIKGGIQTAAQTRGLTGERLAAERRRMALGTSRSAGTAYQQGYGTGVGARRESRQAGIGAMPTEYPSSVDAYGTALTGMTNQQALKSAQARELSKLFGKVLNVPTDETADEKAKSVTLNIG